MIQTSSSVINTNKEGRIFPKTNIKIVDLLKKCPDTSVVQKYIINKKA